MSSKNVLNIGNIVYRSASIADPEDYLEVDHNHEFVIGKIKFLRIHFAHFIFIHRII